MAIFVKHSEIRAAAAQDVEGFPFEQETLLFRESNQAMCRLNASAALIWGLLREGLGPGAIAARLVTEHGVDRPRAAGYVQTLMQDLAANGFLGEADEAAQGAEDGPLRPARWQQPAAELPCHSCFRIDTLPVVVATDDPACLELVERSFAFLRSDSGSPCERGAVGVSILRAGRGRYRVQYAQTTASDCRLDEVPPLVHAAFFLRYYEQNFRTLAFHAAAVGGPSGLVMIPGTSGSGKSTLAAALLCAGYQHVTDELLLVDPGSESLAGAPLAIGLKRGSWALHAGLAAQLERLPAFLRQDGKQVKYLSPPALCRDYALRDVRLMVFPALGGDDRLSMQRLSVPEALFRLTAAGYDSNRRLTREQVARLLEWLAGIPAYELRYRSLERAVAEIGTLCGD